MADLTSFTLVRVKCSPEDTVGDLKKLIAAQTGTDPSKIQLKKWYVLNVYRVMIVAVVHRQVQVYNLQGSYHTIGL